MHSKEYGSPPRRSSSRVLAATAVLLAIAVLLLVVSVVENRRALPFLRDRSAFPVETGSPVVYASAGSGLAAATSEHIQLFSSRGKCVAETDVLFEKPGCAGCTLLGVYYDEGRPGLTALYPDGSVRQTETPGPVFFADVNETGLVTVLLDKSGYKGSILVYDTDLSPLFRWDAGSGYPVSARCSGDDRLCVGTVSAQGSELHFFRIDREEEQAGYSIPGEILLDLGFLSDGTAAAITEERIVFVRCDGTPAADHPFEGRHPAAWWLRGGFAAVSTVTGLEGGSAVLSTLGSDGRILGNCTADRDVTALAGAGDRLLVLYAGSESTLYSSALEEDISYQPDESMTQVFLSADGRAIYAGDSGAVPIDFDR